MNTSTVVLSNLEDLQFTSVSSDELNVIILSYQWMVSLPHSTVSCKNNLPFLCHFLCLILSLLSSPLICDSVISLLCRNTGSSHTARFCFQSTINHTEYSISFTSSSSVLPGWVMFFAQLDTLQWQCSLGLLTGEFLLNSQLKMTFSSPLLLCCYCSTEKFFNSNLKPHSKQSHPASWSVEEGLIVVFQTTVNTPTTHTPN